MEKIETLADFISAAAEYPPGKGWIYRGQTQTTETRGWELRPKAGRKEFSGNFVRIIDLNTPLHGYDLEWFFKWRTQAIAYTRDLPSNDFACLAFAQHYGLATRLLDWSLNPLVALYFAVNDHLDVDGAIYFHAWVQDLTAESLAEPVLNVCCYQPPPFDRRLAAQQGVFTYHPQPQLDLPVSHVASQYEAKPVPILNLRAVTIPSNAKLHLRRQLADVGVTRKSLFPDLDGLSDFINWEVRSLLESWRVPEQ